MSTLKDNLNASAAASAVTVLPHQRAENRGRYDIRRPLLRAARVLVGPDLDFRGSLECEVDRELGKRAAIDGPGIHVPLDAIFRGGRESRATGTVDTTTGAGSTGRVSIPAFAPALRSRMVCGLLGASVMVVDGNAGDQRVARVGGAGGATWVAEGASPDPADTSIDGILLTPKDVTAYLDVTRKQLHSSEPAIMESLLNDLATSLAVALDAATLSGTGLANDPTGLLATTGVDVQAAGSAGGAMTRAIAIEMERVVAAANGDTGVSASLGWAASPNARAAMRAIASGGGWLWSDSGTVLGAPAMVSTAVPSNGTKSTGTGLSTLAFGDWSQAILLLWGGVRILVDPATLSTSGGVRIVASLACDVGIRRAGSFSVCKDIKTS